jgi:hypothetical protein
MNSPKTPTRDDAYWNHNSDLIACSQTSPKLAEELKVILYPPGRSVKEPMTEAQVLAGKRLQTIVEDQEASARECARLQDRLARRSQPVARTLFPSQQLVARTLLPSPFKTRSGRQFQKPTVEKPTILTSPQKTSLLDLQDYAFQLPPNQPPKPPTLPRAPFTISPARPAVTRSKTKQVIPAAATSANRQLIYDPDVTEVKLADQNKKVTRDVRSGLKRFADWATAASVEVDGKGFPKSLSDAEARSFLNFMFANYANPR